MANVLLVEPDAETARTFADALREAEHNVRIAGSAPLALSAVADSIPDVIVAGLAGSRGLRLLNTLRERKITKPVILLTADGDPKARIRALRAGAEDVLSRPVHPDELVIRVLRVLALAADLVGSLAQFGLGSLLPMFEVERRSGILRIAHGTQILDVAVHEGRPVRATVGGNCGVDAIHRALDWAYGTFAFTSSEVNPEDEIGVGGTNILLEHAWQTDHEQAS